MLLRHVLATGADVGLHFVTTLILEGLVQYSAGMEDLGYLLKALRQALEG